MSNNQNEETKLQQRASEHLKEHKKRTEFNNRTPISFEELERVVKEWLLIVDEGIIKVIAGSVIANKMEGDPVWLMNVTSSGGAKTEFINGLTAIPEIYSLSDLTPQTFISGDRKNKNASLLLRIENGSILTLKDFTTVLTMHRDKRHAILAQLREIYDGSYAKAFGTGETKVWNGKLGFIAGVTGIIDNHHSVIQSLGERFLYYRTKQPPSKEIAERAMGNSGHEKQMRHEIKEAFANFISGVKMPDKRIELPDEIKSWVISLATFCATARSSVIRDGYDREIRLIPTPELPTRLVKQLATMVSAFYLMNGNKLLPEDYKIIYKIGVDGLILKRRKIIFYLLENSLPQNINDISKAIRYSANTTRRTLEELVGLEVLERNSGHSHSWSINPKMLELLEEATPESSLEIIKDKRISNELFVEKDESDKVGKFEMFDN